MVGPVLTKKTRVLVWITLLGAAVSISTNLLLVPRLGILGAGWAVALSYASMALALFTFTQKNYTLPYEYKKLAAILGVCIATGAVVYVCKGQSAGFVLTLKILLLTLYPVGMWALVRGVRA